MALLGHVLFDRATGGKQLLKDCAALLDKNVPVFFFPEGTRSRDPPKLLPFKAGAFKLALDAGATIVPITIEVSQETYLIMLLLLLLLMMMTTTTTIMMVVLLSLLLLLVVVMSERVRACVRGVRACVRACME